LLSLTAGRGGHETVRLEKRSIGVEDERPIGDEERRAVGVISIARRNHEVRWNALAREHAQLVGPGSVGGRVDDVVVGTSGEDKRRRRGEAQEEPGFFR
jgi:hypothetical protein